MKRFLLFATLIFTMATLSAQTKPTTYCFVEGEEQENDFIIITVPFETICLINKFNIPTFTEESF